MTFIHGICSSSGKMFRDPEDIKYTPKATRSKKNDYDSKIRLTREGLCHHCKEWIILDSSKDVEVKVPQIYWRKHAHKCHPRV